MADKSLNKTELVAKRCRRLWPSQACSRQRSERFLCNSRRHRRQRRQGHDPGWLGVERTATAARTGRKPADRRRDAIAAGHRVKLTAGSKLKAAAK